MLLEHAELGPKSETLICWKDVARGIHSDPLRMAAASLVSLGPGRLWLGFADLRLLQ